MGETRIDHSLLACGKEGARLQEPGRDERTQTAGHRGQLDQTVVGAAFALEQVHMQFPVERVAHLQAQRGGGGFVFGGRWPAEEDGAVAAMCADLQAADLFLAGLRQPCDQQAGGVGLDQLLRDPQALGRRLRLDPNEVPLVDALLAQAGQVRVLGRSDDSTACDSGTGQRDTLDGRKEGCGASGVLSPSAHDREMAIAAPITVWMYSIEDASARSKKVYKFS
jgi:hypothetical protein